MKTIYIAVIFLVFFNIFCFMFAWFGVFPVEGAYESGEYDMNTTGETTPAEYLQENLTGFDGGKIMSMFFGNLSDAANILVTAVLLGGAAFIAWLTRSPAPFVLVFIGNIVLHLYLDSMVIFEHYPINNYLMLAFGMGMFLLVVITSAEYLTHGDV